MSSCLHEQSFSTARVYFKLGAFFSLREQFLFPNLSDRTVHNTNTIDYSMLTYSSFVFLNGVLDVLGPGSNGLFQMLNVRFISD